MCAAANADPQLSSASYTLFQIDTWLSLMRDGYKHRSAPCRCQAALRCRMAVSSWPVTQNVLHEADRQFSATLARSIAIHVWDAFVAVSRTFSPQYCHQGSDTLPCFNQDGEGFWHLSEPPFSPDSASIASIRLPLPPESASMSLACSRASETSVSIVLLRMCRRSSSWRPIVAWMTDPQVIYHFDYPEESVNSRTMDRYSGSIGTDSQTTRTSGDEDCPRYPIC